MSNLFISYMNADAEIAESLERLLLDKGHQVRIRVGAAVSGLWRTKFTKGLAAADVVLVVLSDSGLTSKNVLGEIGAARVMDYLKGMVVLPILVGEMPVPDFISDLYCFRLKSNDKADLAKLADRLDKAILDDVKSAPRIFISHRHVDEPIAAKLVALLEQAFHIEKNDLRCTSVKPYVLSPGERTSEQLRSDIARSELVIGILGPDTADSNYVLCELGASWGRDVPTVPVLTRGATYADVPSPLNERHSISLENPDHCIDLVEYVAIKTSLKRKEQSAERLGPHVDALTAAASLPRPASKTTPMLIARFMDDDVRAREGRRNIQLGVARCPNDTFQVVFCGHDEGLITDRHALENDLCQVARTNPAKGVIWPAEEESWSVSGDCRFFAIGIRGDGSFAVSAGLCEALENWYRDSVNGTLAEDVDTAIQDLIKNDGTGLYARLDTRRT
jgi:hypothetical protein